MFVFLNFTVIFYETNASSMAPSKKLIEIFPLNYKEEIYGSSSIDEKNSIYNDSLNANKLHDKIFGSISKKPIVVIHTVTAADESITKTTVQRDNTTFINLGSANYYFSNFLARNLRANDVVVQQVLELEKFLRGQDWPQVLFFNCSGSNEKIYADIYNRIPSSRYREHQRFVAIQFSIHTGNSTKSLEFENRCVLVFTIAEPVRSAIN